MGFPRLGHEQIADDKGEVAPLSVSLLYACNDGIDARPLLDQLHAEGVEACRWFASKLTPSDTRTGCSLEHAEARSADVAQWLKERGLWGHAVGYCDTASWNDWGRFEAHGIWFGSFLAARPWLIGEAVNEIGHSTQVPFSLSDLNRLTELIRGAGYHGPLTAGAWIEGDELDANGQYFPGEVSRTDFLTTHFERTDEPAWDMANHGFAELRVIHLEYDRRARMSGEPKRTDDGVLPPGVWPYLLGIEAQGFNTWTTLHSSGLRDCRVLSGGELDDLRTFLRAGRVLPRGRYHYENANNTGGWGNSPVKNAAFCEGPTSNPAEKNVWRAHSFKHEATGQWFLVVYGPNIDRPFLEFQNGFRQDHRIDKFGPYVDVWTLKQG